MNPIVNIQNAMRMYDQLKSGNAEAIYNQMMGNPQFKEFMEKNKGKSPEQIAKENGIDLSLLNQFR